MKRNLRQGSALRQAACKSSDTSVPKLCSAQPEVPQACAKAQDFCQSFATTPLLAEVRFIVIHLFYSLEHCEGCLCVQLCNGALVSFRRELLQCELLCKCLRT